MFEAAFPYILGLWGGVALGFFYFGGLWLTVKRVPASSKPKTLLFWSAVLRLTPTLVALFVALKANPGIFLVMLPGFFGVRYFMTRRVSTMSQGAG